MQSDNLFDLSGVGDLVAGGVSAVVGIVDAAIYIHGGHFIRLGPPGSNAHYIGKTGHTQHRHDHKAGCRTLPVFQHPEGLAQQHPGHKVAHHSPYHHAYRQGEPVSPSEEGNGVDAEAQSGAEGHAIQKDGPHQAHGDHVPRRLHLPLPVHQQGQHRQHHTGGGVGGYGTGAQQVPLPRGGGHSIHRLLYRIPLHSLGKGPDWGKNLGQSASPAAVHGEPEEEIAQNSVDQHIEDIGQHV